MEIKLPETTDVCVKFGDQEINSDIIELNDMIFYSQEKHIESDSYEQDWMNDFRLSLRQRFDVQLSYGQAAVLAKAVIEEAKNLMGKLDQ